MDKQLEQLEAILKQQTAAHEKLLTLLKRKREAVRTAQHEQVASLTHQENQAVQAISDLEKQRLALVGELTLIVDPAAKQPMRLAQLAQHLEEPTRGHLLVLRQELADRLKQTQQETAVAKRVTETLVRHMQGLIQTVGGAITGVGVYSRQGAVPKEALAVNTFNATA